MKYVKIKLSALGMRKIVAKKNSDRVDKAFLECLCNYVIFSKNVNRTFISCPFCNENHSFRKIYNVEDCNEGKLCKLIYSYKETRVKVGNSIMYIVSEDGKVLYEVPDLFFHFFAEHNMIPREFFRKAVIYGVKPGTSQYCEYIKEEFLNDTNLDLED
ncbi:MAG: hypothetical protein HDT30_06365 [Clostridiales bacterium]|nr:hypothetical protein [Clostridiales bacterium]